MPVLLRPVNNFLGQVIGNASEGKYNTVNNSSSGGVTFQKCLNSGITLFSSKNGNKSQTFATGANQRLHEARPRRVVWLWKPEYRYRYRTGQVCMCPLYTLWYHRTNSYCIGIGCHFPAKSFSHFVCAGCVGL